MATIHVSNNIHTEISVLVFIFLEPTTHQIITDRHRDETRDDYEYDKILRKHLPKTRDAGPHHLSNPDLFGTLLSNK